MYHRLLEKNHVQEYVLMTKLKYIRVHKVSMAHKRPYVIGFQVVMYRKI